MGALNQEPSDSLDVEQGSEGTQSGGSRQRSVYPCNFRSAGRLSNENARALTTIHETFARHLASSMEAYLGTGVKI